MPEHNLRLLFINDDEYEQARAQLFSCAQQAQEIWNTYISTSLAIVGEERNIEGARANAYADFIDVCNEMFAQKLEEIFTTLNTDMEQYIVNIDTADQVLY